MIKEQYDIVIENTESTVVAEYSLKVKRASSYQSEAELEKDFIKQLESQAYESLKITSEASLILNLRKQLEKLNRISFTENEWHDFFKDHIQGKNQGVIEKTKTIQEDHTKLLTREDGSTKNIILIDKKNIHNNILQVINQYTANEGLYANRYDVTILVNGLPLIHVELKRRGVALQEAFNQIKRYAKESFWSGSGLFEYVQIFVISNGTHTKYYSNTIRSKQIQEEREKKKTVHKTSHSFEFTNWWADATNKSILDLTDFTATFFSKHTILNILTKYCVFTSEQLLLVMRPYQIVATEKIVQRINISNHYKTYGSIQAGGYIWHTTGSGKTLTSFKTAQLISKLDYIDKVLFVVDRKDLDYQTMKEYDKFEKGAANSNKDTKTLKKQLENSESRIIITTIQKLSKFISANKKHSIFEQHIVFIFDECHRSQFGEMHTDIVKAFKKYHLFGFTGTPIFAANSSSSSKANLKTTEQAFGEKLHTYSIVDAIADKNVLPFKVDYISTFKATKDIEEKEVMDIDREAVLLSPERLTNIVKYILEHFNTKTKRNSLCNNDSIRFSGFNSIFAVSSIEAAKKYYLEFKKQGANIPENKRLRVATIFSFGLNDGTDGVCDENSDSTDDLGDSDRIFLEKAIQDYNQIFGTSFDTSSDKFQNYYKDVSGKVKTKEIDILIVVNMFLTGFDSTTLNTLWVDKNLKLHGLLQAYSRTNRIYNSVKTFGNIVCFRKLEEATNKAIELFGNKEAGGVVLLKSYDDYYNGYYQEDGTKVRGYKNLIEELTTNFPVDEQIRGEQKEKDFIQLYGSLLKITNILSVFDKFPQNELLTPREKDDYKSIYITLYQQYRNTIHSDTENINDDIIFEIELIKQVEINIDFILSLIKQYDKDSVKDKEILISISKAIDSSISLRNKKELIHQFIDSLNSFMVSTDIDQDIDTKWQNFVSKKKIEDLEAIIQEENLNKEATYKFISTSFRDGFISTLGTEISSIIPPVSRFAERGDLSKTKEQILNKLKDFFDRFFDISSNHF